MSARRIIVALLLAACGSLAAAEGRSASFSVSVRVVAPLRSRTAAPEPAGVFVIAPGRASSTCGTAGSAACRAAVAAAAPASGVPVVVTTFTDGTPTAVVER